MSANETQIVPVHWLKWLGDHRDGFLLGGAFVYGVGYLVWSYNASQHHLGQLPALEAHYIVAGLVPAAVLVIALLAKKLCFWVCDSVPKQEKVSTQRKLAAYVCLAVIFIGCAVSFRFCFYSLSAVLGGVVASIFGYLGLVLFGGGLQPRFSLIRTFMVYAFAICALPLYLSLYPKLPQSLGGPRPRQAYVDLVISQIAPASIEALVGPDYGVKTAGDALSYKTGGSADGVVQSKRLNVYFSNSDYMLVRVATEIKPHEGTLFELRKEVIRAVQWCSD